MHFICLLFVGQLGMNQSFAQKADSALNSMRAKKINKVPQIKVDLPNYRAKYYLGKIPYDGFSNLRGLDYVPQRTEKNLTVLKIYPNPVNDKVNLIIRLDQEANFSVRILDMLGNEVVTLANERLREGEQTKNYAIPNRLNPGVYFLRISAGAETIVKRISVL